MRRQVALQARAERRPASHRGRADRSRLPAAREAGTLNRRVGGVAIDCTGAIQWFPEVLSPMLRLSFAALCVLAALRAQQPGRGAAQPPARTPSIEERATGMTKIDGLFPVYWEERTGNLYLEIPRLDTPVLYATGIAAGLGSNDIGLDRGQEGSGKIVTFERVGPRVLMLQRQPRRTALSGGRLRQVGALGLHGRRRERRRKRWPRPGGRHRFLPARR